jgi:hypothetical protein
MTKTTTSSSLGIQISLSFPQQDLVVRLASSSSRGLASISPPPQHASKPQHNGTTMTNDSSSTDIDAQIERLRNGEALSELEVKNLCEQVCGKQQKASFRSHFHPFVCNCWYLRVFFTENDLSMDFRNFVTMARTFISMSIFHFSPRQLYS